MKETKDGSGHMPKLEDMVLQESETAVNFSSVLADTINDLHVPVNKDGKPDTEQFINHLMREANQIAEKHLKDNPRYNPAWLPGYEAIKSALDTTPGAIKEGHLTLEGKNTISQLYNSTIDNYVGQRGQGRFQSASAEDSKTSGISLANITSNKYLVPLIKGAKTSAEVAARIGQAITDTIEKARRYRQTHATSEGFAKAYAPAYSHS